ncbi:MAG: signal peptidase I [Verrucomicrobiota bacterium]
MSSARQIEFQLFIKVIFIVYKVSLLSGCNHQNYVEFKVSSTSMEPEFEANEAIRARLLCKQSEIRRGDVVVISPPQGYKGARWLRRIAAIPGDKVVFDGDRLLINGLEVSDLDLESIGLSVRQIEMINLVLGSEDYYVTGDNLSNAIDSRHFGPIKWEHFSHKVIH